MGLFSRKSQPLNLPPDDEQRWGIAQADDGGNPLIVRFNETARDWIAHEGLTIRLGFAAPLNRPVPGGLPDAAENAQLLEAEDVILGIVQPAVAGLHVLTLTDGHMKEWVFYVAAGADIARLHADIRSQVKTHDIHCLAVNDPQWGSYRQFVPPQEADA